MRIRVNDLTFSYDQKVILNHLSFSINSGDFLTITGKNGSGKSTLIKCLLKLQKVQHGMIFLDDVDINEIKKHHHIGYVPQKAEFNYEFPITVKEILMASYPQRAYDQFYKSIISSLNLNKFYHENINNLSGGQLQRIFIARALLTKPRLLILDEPTVGIDTENMHNLYQILKKLKEEKITIILITHDQDFAKDLYDYILHLDEYTNYTFTKMEEKHHD